MTRTTNIVLATAVVLATAMVPAHAAGYVGLEVSNNGLGFGFGTSNWGIWGSSWDSAGPSYGFSATLAGYGEWVRVDGLGQVWRPWVAAGWQPYTHGRWVWTSLGWTWVAYEPWGWAPHHYGNWAFSTVGWVWSPGYAYHPGNVVWVSSGIHVGWYPCAPVGWSHFNRGYYNGWNRGYAAGHSDGYAYGYEDGWRDARYATWVPWSGLNADNVAQHVVTHEMVTHQSARSRVTAMATPPTRSEVEQRSGRSVPETRVVERQATIDGHSVRVVRPEGQAAEVRRHGPETVDRALAPIARKRVTGGEGRPVASAEHKNTGTERQINSATSRVDTRTSGEIQRDSPASRSGSRAPTADRPRPATDQQPRDRSPSAEGSRRALDTTKTTPTGGIRSPSTENGPQWITQPRNPTPPVAPPSRARAPVKASSPHPAGAPSGARQVRPEPAKEDASDTRPARGRTKADPANEKGQKARQRKN